MRLHRIAFAAGFAAGFVAGTRAGRERYEQMVKMVRAAKDSPAVQHATSTVQSQAGSVLTTAKQKVTDGAPRLASTAVHRASDRMPLRRHREARPDAAADGEAQAGDGHPFATASDSQAD